MTITEVAKDQFVDGDKVATRMTAHVHNRETGEPMTMIGINLAVISGGKIQEEWFKTLEKFIVEFPESEKAADAMFQLGSSFESMGDEEKAKTWYARAAKDFAGMPIAEKSAGALRRLQSVGNTIPFVGKTFESQQVVDLAKLTGKVVLIYYWTTL